MKQILISIVGAAIGGTLGFFGFFWLASHGYYGMILPGGLLGIGAGMGKSRSTWLAVASGAAALFLGLFTEWRWDPIRGNPSFTYFLSHLTSRDSVTLIMIAIGGALGFWIPFRRPEPESPARGK